MERRIREQAQIGNMYIDLIEDKLGQIEAELEGEWCSSELK